MLQQLIQNIFLNKEMLVPIALVVWLKMQYQNGKLVDYTKSQHLEQWLAYPTLLILIMLLAAMDQHSLDNNLWYLYIIDEFSCYSNGVVIEAKFKILILAFKNNILTKTIN